MGVVYDTSGLDRSLALYTKRHKLRNKYLESNAKSKYLLTLLDSSCIKKEF